MAVAFDQRVGEEALVSLHTAEKYRHPLVQSLDSWDEKFAFNADKNLVSWALSGTYDEDTPVSAEHINEFSLKPSDID